MQQQYQPKQQQLLRNHGVEGHRTSIFRKSQTWYSDRIDVSERDLSLEPALACVFHCQFSRRTPGTVEGFHIMGLGAVEQTEGVADTELIS